MVPALPKAGSSRRDILRRAAFLGVLGLAGCDARASPWHGTNVSGSLPPLALRMTSATTGAAVDAATFRGKIVLLTFGYTSCPDVCPLTLSNLARVLRDLGSRADQVSVLFVTVDPGRDTLAVLRFYTGLFAPGIVGLRGDADALAWLARRYRVAYSVTPASPRHPYAVTHSALVYVFDRRGAARLIVTSLSTPTPDIAGTAADLRRLIDRRGAPSLWDRLAAFA
jgi:protein SCO1/2